MSPGATSGRAQRGSPRPPVIPEQAGIHPSPPRRGWLIEYANPLASAGDAHAAPSANNAPGALLQGMLGKAMVRSENTQVIEGHAGLQPDILVTATGRSPVVVEAEYDPAQNVEPEARDRLGLKVNGQSRPIEAAIALRYPESVGDTADLPTAVRDATLRYCVFTLEGEDHVRFPLSGWLDGSVTDLADLVRLVSVPQNAVDQAATYLQQGIDDAANILEEMHLTSPGITVSIAGLLGMDNVPQTRRMACAIVANAMIFHDRIAGMHDSINALNLVCGDAVPDPQGETLSAWTAILKINYWPIFAIGRDILGQLPAEFAVRTLRRLRLTAASVNGTGMNNAHDLTGRVFQRLISDRKYLATFYTLPASAALLARLAVAKMEGVDWGDSEAIGKLKVGDFACGTGALLSAVYDQIASRHESAGGDASAIHPVMMEEVLYGCDVMPSAIHITGSTLAGIQPEVGYEKSRLYTMPYGRQEDGTVKIGSLELLQSSSVLTLFNTSDPALRTGSAGEETAAQVNVEIADGTFDLVIMNPPFTRAGSDWEGSSRSEDYVKQFRGLATSLDTQKEMAKQLGKFANGTCYHGYAGIASAFVALADKKLKPGGVLALVLPMSVAAGVSWLESRSLLTGKYIDLEVLSIAANGSEMSFSSDTGMAECLVVARKNPAAKDDPAPSQIRLISLRHRPSGFGDASAISKTMTSATPVRSVAEGPYGGTILTVGDDIAGEVLIAPQPNPGTTWGGVCILDYALAQSAFALSRSEIWLPGQAQALNLSIVTLNEIGKRGWHDINIAGSKAPFFKVHSSTTATYPTLWNHNAKKETSLICEPDFQLQVRAGREEKAAEAWGTASRAHLNRDFTFGSQPLGVAFTERESIGGRVWPNVRFANNQHDYVFAVWGNSTLGLLCHWWHSSRQQSSKAGMSISAAETLPVLDFRTLSDAQLATAERIFDEFRELDLMPAYLADADPNRAVLDRRVLCDLLGFDDDIYRGVRRLAQKWCAEPSVHGGKARPKSAKYVE